MTNPGWSAQQANQQQQQTQRSASFHRDAAYQGQLRYRRRQPRGPIGAVRRFFGFVFALVFIAIAVAIFLTILSVARSMG